MHLNKFKNLFLGIIFVFCLILQNSALAYGFMPGSGEGINNFGIGVYFAPQEIKIYGDSDDDSNQIVEAQWDEMDFDCSSRELGSKSMFFAYKPEHKIALMLVTDETDDTYEVIYNLATGAKGWIKKNQHGKFYTWKNFMEEYGKKYGIYIFTGMPANLKQVRTAPSEKGQPIKNNYYWAKDINLFNIRGNWMLIKIVDYNRETPVGWIKWRGEDGRVYVFPQLDQI